MTKSSLPEIIARNEEDLLSEWIRLQNDVLSDRRDRISQPQLRAKSEDFLHILSATLSDGAGLDIGASGWSSMRDLLTEFGRQRVEQGFTPSETATFVLSFKQPLFAQIGVAYAGNTKELQDEIWTASELLDKLGLYTIEVFQKTRENVISRQQQEMLELSTPVVELWNGLLALPLIGTLDSGCLLDTARYGLAHEPTLGESIVAGVDVVCASGDKLLGGPQAGLILGRAAVVERIARHPLARALRADKTCLAGLAATLRHYACGEGSEQVPVWWSISRNSNGCGCVSRIG